MISKIDDFFVKSNEEKLEIERTTWFVYRLIDDESKRVMLDK